MSLTEGRDLSYLYKKNILTKAMHGSQQRNEYKKLFHIVEVVLDNHSQLSSPKYCLCNGKVLALNVSVIHNEVCYLLETLSYLSTKSAFNGINPKRYELILLKLSFLFFGAVAHTM
jgi:hypothetical protein